MSDIDAGSVKGYVLFKAFDVISDGSYKKLVVKSKECNETWAIELHTSTQKINAHIKNVLHMVNTLGEYGKDRLQDVCREVLCHVSPPCKLKTCWNICAITGTRSAECIDLTRVGKSDTVVTVHRKFSHFVIMLWIVAKFEHLCKVYTRQWLASKAAGEHSVHELCTLFQQEAVPEITDALYNAFKHAVTHVTGSLEVYRRLPCFGSV